MITPLPVYARNGILEPGQLTVMSPSGVSHSAGIVPDPGFTSGTTRFLREDATWATPLIANITGPGNAIANTTTQTSLFTGAAFLPGQSLTIPANSLEAGDEIEILLFGAFSCSGNPGMTVNVMLGSTVVMQGTLSGMTETTTNGQWVIGAVPTRFCFQQVGVNGGCMGYGQVAFVNSASGNALSTFNLYSGSGAGLGSGTLVAIDTTRDLAFDVQIAWNTANASDTIQLLAGNVTKAG
jgi:predicted RecA/RadA family phage recombinase